MPHLVSFPLSHAFDGWRNLRGVMLDRVGLGVNPAPSYEIFALPGARVRAFAEPGEGDGPSILLVPAPIKGPMVWDMGPEASPVRRLLEAGLRPYVLEWEEVGRRAYGLAAHIERILLPCLDAVAAREDGTRPFMAGHSLGGTLAAALAAARPEAVRGLVLIESSLAFAVPGAEDPFAPAARETLPPASGGPMMSGTELSLLTATLAPDVFVWQRRLDALTAIPASLEDVLRRRRVERWVLAEKPLPAPLVGDIIESLYRRDALMAGGLEVAGAEARLDRLTASVVMIADPGGRLVPIRGLEAACGVMASNDVDLWPHPWEPHTGLRHLSPLVGKEANRTLWPRLAAWMRERA